MEYLLKASAIIVLFYICYKLFLKRETFFQHNRWFLLSGLFVALCIPFIIIPIYIEYTSTPIQDFTVISQVLGETIVIEEPFSWVQLLPWIYISGIIFFFSRLLIDLFSLARLMYRNKSYKKDNYTFIEVKGTIAPFSFFNNIVYNPKQFDKKELELIINHEKVHAKQYHSIDILLIQLATVLFWFNPLIWLYKKVLQQNLEYIADDKAQSIAECKKSYQHILLKASVPNHQLSLTNNFYNSLIKKRIVMLHKSKSKTKNLWKFALILPFLSIFLMSFNTEDIYIPITENNLYKNETNQTPGKEIVSNKSILKDIKIIITKDFTDEDLEKAKAEALKEGITLTFSDIKRNDKDEIIEIFAEFDGKEVGSGKYYLSSDIAIQSFAFSSNKDRTGFEMASNNNTLHSDDKDNLQNRFLVYQNENNKLIISGADEDKVLYILDGNEISKTDLDTMDLNSIKSVEVLKGEAAIKTYGNKGKEGVIILKTKDLKGWAVGIPKATTYNAIVKDSIYISKNLKFATIDTLEIKNRLKLKNDFYFQRNDKPIAKRATIIKSRPSNSNNSLYYFDDDRGKPLFIIDNKIIEEKGFKKLNPNNIVSMNVIKGKDAVILYGEKGKNGVIIILTQKPKDLLLLSNKNDSPLGIESEVSIVSYYDDNDASKNASLAFISKYSTDKVLKLHKADLKNLGLKVKYSKIKRNKSGEIVRIKISLSDENGRKSSATFEDNKGIVNIEYGISGNRLIVKSKN